MGNDSKVFQTRSKNRFSAFGTALIDGTCAVDKGGCAAQGPQPSLMRFLREGYTRDPFKQLLVGQDESITYAQAYLRAVALARYLRDSHGIGQGKTVLVAAANATACPYVLASVQLCGARLAIMSPTIERAEFVRMLSLAKPDIAIMASEAQCRMAEGTSPSLTVLTLACPGAPVPIVEDIAREVSAVGPDDGGFPDVDDPEVVLFTSGSTGLPKAVVHRSSSFLRSGRVLDDALRATSADVFFVPVPFAHVYGIVGLYAALSLGATVVTGAKYRPETSLALISATRASLYFGVSTMYLRELRANQDESWDLSCLRAGLVAGASCPEVVFREYERRYGCRIIQSYGMTETAAALTVSELDDPLEVRANTVGRPISGARARILKDGEVACSSPSMMTGLLDSAGSCCWPFEDEGWLRTGDAGSVGEDGRLRITGRLKDMIIRGGINIFPAEVENAYQGHPDVAECCLVGYPDPELGERSCLCVIENDGAGASAFALRGYAKGRVEKCKMPDVVLKLDAFPRLNNGKIDKKALKESVKAVLTAPHVSRPAGTGESR